MLDLPGRLDEKTGEMLVVAFVRQQMGQSAYGRSATSSEHWVGLAEEGSDRKQVNQFQ